MPGYRIYVVGPHGRFVDVEEVERATDAEVLAHGESLLSRHPHLEIWEQGRFVGTLKAERDTTPAAPRMMPGRTLGGVLQAAVGLASEHFYPPPLARRL